MCCPVPRLFIFYACDFLYLLLVVGVNIQFALLIFCGYLLNECCCFMFLCSHFRATVSAVNNPAYYYAGFVLCYLRCVMCFDGKWWIKWLNKYSDYINVCVYLRYHGPKISYDITHDWHRPHSQKHSHLWLMHTRTPLHRSTNSADQRHQVIWLWE